ncbi:MAG: hypothetical protein ACREFO_16830 [Acetobacteraceae bacterium]
MARRPGRVRAGAGDALGPARGILLSALIGLALWGIIFSAVWVLFLR